MCTRAYNSGGGVVRSDGGRERNDGAVDDCPPENESEGARRLHRGRCAGREECMLAS